MTYAARTRQPPRTIPDAEIAKLLKVSGQHRDAFRDHVIISVALGLGLRKMEIAALNVGDVAIVDGKWPKCRRLIQLRVYARKGRKGEKVDPKAQRCHVPDGCFYKLEKYLRGEFKARGFRPGASDPLFVGRGGARLSGRRIHELFHYWQRRAGFEHLYSFHELRHTAITNAYRLTKNIRIAQRVARHSLVQTTTIYEHASDQEVADAIRKLAS